MAPLGALDWQLMQIGLGAGLFTKSDKRFSSPPTLDIARDVQFEELGGVQTRLPFAAMSNSIFGGGSLSNCRRLAVVNGELCVFTSTALYSWNAQQSAWVLRGTHLAVTVTETSRFVTTDDQVDGDRAELAGTVLFAWSVNNATTYVAALDKSTASVLMAPTAIAGTFIRPRLVALSTKILLFVHDNTGDLKVFAIDPASPATAIAGAATTVLGTNANFYYDVVRAGTQDLVVGACRRVVTTSYEAFTVTPGLVVTNSTKPRSCDGPIAVATIADGTQTQVVRGNNTNVQGDLLTTSTLADVFTAQPIGTVLATPIHQIAAAFVSTTCTAFWSRLEATDDTAFEAKTNTITTGSVPGTESQFAINIGIASRAFARGSSVYLWMAFGSDSTAFGSGSPPSIRAQLQNTYYLYRNDGLVVSKATWDVGGGFAPSIGHLPGITATGSNDYAWAGAWRRRIELGDDIDHTGLAARSPRDIAFSFDDNAARRSTQHGRTLYVSGGIVAMYDGRQIVEVGFNVYPWAFAAVDLGGGGNLSAGAYGYKATYRWQNAQGEVERSTTATGETVTVSANDRVSAPTALLQVTNKLSPSANIEVWRTLVNAGNGAPFYLTTSQDPTATAGNNRYIPNVVNVTFAPAAYIDALSDTTLAVREANPENDGVLEALAPAGARIIVATDTRILLAGIAGDPDRVWYSRERGDGEIASFNDALTIDVPPMGGDVTALWVMDGVLYVGRQYAIYAIPGVGFDNTGGGQGFGPAQIVSLDVGPVSQEAQCLTPLGTLLKTAKGYYLMDRGRNLRYVGAAVNAFDADTVVAMTVMTALHEVRILTTSRLLAWTYTDAVDLVDAQTPGGMGQWSERTVSDGLDAVLWNGGYVYLTSTGPKQEQASYSGLSYGLDVESSWIKLNGLQGYGKVGEVMILGEYRSAHLLRIRLARDYQYDGSGNVVYFDDRAWNPSPTTVSSALQVRHSPSASNGNCEAIKIRITAVAEQTRATLATGSALSPTVTTNGAAWGATWAAANTGTPGVSFPGLMGNSISMTLAFASGSTPSIDVRDHLTWSTSLGRWRESVNNVGVLVTGTNASTTVAALETAIAAATRLCTLQTPDGTPGKLVAIATLAGTSPSGSFSGGAYTSPPGEALKLTGIALRVGLKPGLYGRLPAAQKE